MPVQVQKKKKKDPGGLHASEAACQNTEKKKKRGREGENTHDTQFKYSTFV